MAIDAAFAPLAEILPADEYLFLSKRGFDASFWRSLIFRKWDSCLEFTGTDRGALVAAASRAKIRATYQRHASFSRRLVFNHFVDADVKTLHTVDYHLALSESLPNSSQPLLRISPSISHSVSARLHSVGVSGGFVVMHPGSARAEKMWSPENWALVARFLREEYLLDVILTGGNDPLEITQIEKIRQLSGSKGIFAFAGGTTLSEVAAIIAKARAYVGVDTGASHMADLLGVPSAVLYGGTNPRHWGPRGPKGRAVGMNGFSCHPHDFSKCEMRDIPVENLVAALRDLMGP